MNAAFIPANFFEIPIIADFIAKDGPETEIAPDCWAVMRGRLNDLSQQNMTQLKEDCARMIRKARRSADCASPIAVDFEENDDELANWSCDQILYHWTTFFNNTHHSNIPTFRELVTYVIRPANLISYLSLAVTADVRNDSPLYHFAPSSNLINIVNALSAILPLPKDSTMEDIISLGEAFTCQMCNSTIQKPMTWPELVRAWPMYEPLMPTDS